MEAEVEAEAAALAAAAEQRKAEGLLGAQPLGIATEHLRSGAQPSGAHRSGAQAVGVGVNTAAPIAAPAVASAPTLEELAANLLPLTANLHSEWLESVGEGGAWAGSGGDGARGATPGTTPKTQCRKSVCGWSCELE